MKHSKLAVRTRTHTSERPPCEAEGYGYAAEKLFIFLLFPLARWPWWSRAVGRVHSASTHSTCAQTVRAALGPTLPAQSFSLPRDHHHQQSRPRLAPEGLSPMDSLGLG